MAASAAILLAVAGISGYAVAEEPGKTPADRPGQTDVNLGWPQWRGPTRDGVAPSQKWSWKWPKEGPKRLWTVTEGIYGDFGSMT